MHPELMYQSHQAHLDDLRVLQQLRTIEHDVVTTLLHHPPVPAPGAAQEHLAHVLDDAHVPVVTVTEGRVPHPV